MRNRFYLLFFTSMLFLPSSYAQYATKEIKIECQNKPIQYGTLTMQFDSLKWQWQCDDISLTTAYVVVRPMPAILDIGSDTYLTNQAKSDKECNRGELTSYYSDDVACSKMMNEFVHRGMSVIYEKMWKRERTTYRRGHGFIMNNQKGEEIYLIVELESWLSTNFGQEGSIEMDNGKVTCRIKPINSIF